MTAVLTLRHARRGADGIPVLSEESKDAVLTTTTLKLGDDGTIAMKKQDIADAVGLGDTTPDCPFEGPDPKFQQFVTVHETFDHYYIKPTAGWGKQNTLDFYVTIRNVSRTTLCPPFLFLPSELARAHANLLTTRAPSLGRARPPSTPSARTWSMPPPWTSMEWAWKWSIPSRAAACPRGAARSARARASPRRPSHCSSPREPVGTIASSLRGYRRIQCRE